MTGREHGSPVPGLESLAELRALREAVEQLREQNDELLDAQTLLEEAKDDYAEIHDLAPLALLTLTQTGIIRSANLAAAELLEEERSALVGRPLLAFCAPRSRPELQRVLGGNNAALRTIQRVELALSRGSGIPVELRARASLRRPGVLHLALVDPRERDELREATESKDHVIAMLSHEMRTPLTPALALASKMTREPSIGTELRESFKLIERNLTAEARLIDDLLDATGIARGKLRIERRLLDVHEVLRESVEAMQASASRKQIALAVMPQATLVRANADPLRLRQLFSNLLRNALKFTPERGKIDVRTWDGEQSVVIEVNDTGVGFAPEDGERIFAAFDQMRCGGQAGQGLGLGLAICKGLVELHGGKISASSPGPGKGARFVVQLPVEGASFPELAAETLLGRTRPDVPQSDDVRRCRLLLVEDHEDTSEIMSEILRELGYEVIAVASCQAALAVPLDDIDLIVSDLGLPDGSGLELLPRLRQGRHVPAVALSGYGRSADIEASKSAGFELHLTKPVDFPKLLEGLRILTQALGSTAST